MNVLETTIEFKGNPVRIKDGKIYLRAFGTTIYNQNMHYSWMEVKESDLVPELRSLLKENKLI